MTSAASSQATGDDPYFFTDDTDGDDFIYTCGASTTGETSSADASADSGDDALPGSVGGPPPGDAPGDIVGPAGTNNGDLGSGSGTDDWWDELWNDSPPLGGVGKLQGLGNQGIEHVDSKHVDSNAGYPNAPGQSGGQPVQYQPNPVAWGGNDHVPLKLQWAASTGGEWAATHAIELPHLGSSIAPNGHDFIM